MSKKMCLRFKKKIKFIHDKNLPSHDTFNFIIFKCYPNKPRDVVVSVSSCHARGPEFDSGQGKVHSAFQHFGMDKMVSLLGNKSQRVPR